MSSISVKIRNSRPRNESDPRKRKGDGWTDGHRRPIYKIIMHEIRTKAILILSRIYVYFSRDCLKWPPGLPGWENRMIVKVVQQCGCGFWMLPSALFRVAMRRVEDESRGSVMQLQWCKSAMCTKRWTYQPLHPRIVDYLYQWTIHQQHRSLALPQYHPHLTWSRSLLSRLEWQCFMNWPYPVIVTRRKRNMFGMKCTDGKMLTFLKFDKQCPLWWRVEWWQPIVSFSAPFCLDDM